MDISFKKILACMVVASFCIGADAENVAEGVKVRPVRLGLDGMLWRSQRKGQSS